MRFDLDIVPVARAQLQAAIQRRQGDPDALDELHTAYAALLRALLDNPLSAGVDHPDGGGRRIRVRRPLGIVYGVRHPAREVVVLHISISERG
jgi:hypothetical protein